MVTTLLDKKQIVNDICNTVVFYRDVQNILVVNNRTISIQYLTHIGTLIADRINELMHRNYPTQDYEIRIKHGEYSLELTLL